MPFKDGIYWFRQFHIPEHMLESIKMYVNEKRPVGDFLKAVICNDLREAVGCADDMNIANLPAYVGYFYNEAPGVCWGSRGEMEKWLGDETDLCN